MKSLGKASVEIALFGPFVPLVFRLCGQLLSVGDYQCPSGAHSSGHC